jgi:hypothetical protein
VILVAATCHISSVAPCGMVWIPNVCRLMGCDVTIFLLNNVRASRYEHRWIMKAKPDVHSQNDITVYSKNIRFKGRFEVNSNKGVSKKDQI